MELEIFAVLVSNFDRHRSVAHRAEDRCWRIGKEEGWWWHLGPVAYAHRQRSVALRAEDRCWRIGKEEGWWRLGPVAYAHRQRSVALWAEDRC